MSRNQIKLLSFQFCKASTVFGSLIYGRKNRKLHLGLKNLKKKKKKTTEKRNNKMEGVISKS